MRSLPEGYWFDNNDKAEGYVIGNVDHMEQMSRILQQIDISDFKSYYSEWVSKQHVIFPTLPANPTVQDWFNEFKWAKDPDPRTDLTHPFVD